MLLHVEGELFGLAGEHFGDLQQGEEKHELEVLAGEALFLLGGGLGAGGLLAGEVDAGPGVLQCGGLGDEGCAEIGLVGGDGGEQGLEVVSHLVVVAGAEDGAALGHAFGHFRRVIAIPGGDGGDEFGDGIWQRFAEVVLGFFPRFAQAELGLVVGEAIGDEVDGGRGGGDARGELAALVVGDHALLVIGGEGEQLSDADAVVIEGVFQEA